MADSAKASSTVYWASFAALLGALSVGLTLGYTAPAFHDMQVRNSTEIFNDTNKDERQSWIGSSLALGALVGGIITDPSNNFLGRRMSMIASGIPFAIGWILIGLANGPAMLIAGRVVNGLCSGLICGVAPTYVIEISTPKIRGLLGTCFQLMVVIGIMIEAIFGTFLSWRALALINVTFALAMALLMLFMPETPQWLLSKDRNNDAELSLKSLRSTPIETELNELSQSNRNNQRVGGSYTYETLGSIQFYKPLILSLLLMFFQQFSGINAILFYQTRIFESAAPSLNPSLATIAVCVAQVIATAVGSGLVDRLGRRILLLASGAGHAISLVLFGFCEHMTAKGDTSLSVLALLSLIIFISSFSIGYGPIPWMMVPELAPTHLRSIIASIATTFNWTCVFLVTASVKPLMNQIGNDLTYWLFATICGISCLFVALFLPETKGKTSEQIQRELLGPRASEIAQSSEEGRSLKSMS